MIFNSLSYFLFLPAVFLIYHYINVKYRWIVLLLASICFYAALCEPHLLMILFFIIIISFTAGITIGNLTNEKQKLIIMWAGILLLLLPLIHLKYTAFLPQFISILLQNTSSDGTRLLSAIGISFFTFQAISYLIDVYLGTAGIERHLGYFALYIAFFPKLLQGPIERAECLLPQIKQPTSFNYENVRYGLVIFAIGLFKKTVIAARLNPLVSEVYNNVNNYDGISFWIATFFYAAQIYCDFSGYTDMAIGSALLFNIRLTDNFNHPYAATSIADFWRRWHITFSRWLMDYIFKPLQMKFRNLRMLSSIIALLITFFICGLWHGRTLNFIIWGIINGLYISFSVLTSKHRKKIIALINLERLPVLFRIIRIFTTFLLTCFGWIFFRANNISDSIYIVTNLFDNIGLLLENIFISDYLKSHVFLGQNSTHFILTAMLLCLVFFSHFFINKRDIILAIFKKPIYVRWFFYYAILYVIIIFGQSEGQQFIYFQF